MPRPLLAAVLVLLAPAAAPAQLCPSGTFVPIASGPNGAITAAVRVGNRIFVRGGFTTVGGASAVAVAQFDGGATAGAWLPMTSGWPYDANQASGLAALDDRLYATSRRSNGPVIDWDAPSGVVWDGTSWSQWPTTGQLPGLSAAPTLGVFNIGDKLLCEGQFTFDHPDPNLTYRRRFAFFDGNSWTMPGSQYGLNVDVDNSTVALNCVARYNGLFHVGGGFNAIARGDAFNASTVPASSIAVWDGAAFQPLPNGGLNGTVRSMVVFQDQLYVAGDFTATADGTVQLNHIASYDGSWRRVGGGINQPVQSMIVADDGTGEKLHIIVLSDAAATAYNQPIPTTDTVAFRGVVRWTGIGFQSYGPVNSAGIFGAAGTILPVRFDNGTGEAVYFLGVSHSIPGQALTRVSRWGPGPLTDTDRDGIFDLWETTGIDANCDGVIDLDLFAMGARANHVDVFVEVDSMVGRAPTMETLNRVVTAFDNAPGGLIGNPDGEDGVKLHLIVDPADQSIPLQNFPNTFADFHPLKSQYFGDAADRASPNRTAILDAKKRVFRYCIFANSFNNSGSSGVAECPGNDFMVTLGTFRPVGGTADMQAGTFMHELGHTLGLFHGGHEGGLDPELDVRFNYKPNYHSVMNYTWQLPRGRPGWRLDYSREVLAPLNETQLDETLGIGGQPGVISQAGPPPGRDVPESGPVNWDLQNGIDLSFSVYNINNIDLRVANAFLDTLHGSEDWSRLQYNFRQSDGYASGDSPQSTIHTDNMTQALLDAMSGITPCLADVAGLGGGPNPDGQLTPDDVIAFLTAFFAGNLPVADIASLGGSPTPDGQLTPDDLIAFLGAFFTGCP